MDILPKLALFTHIESAPLMLAVTGGIMKIAIVTVSPKQPDGPCSTNLSVSIPDNGP
jgi:hypothetical protein